MRIVIPATEKVSHVPGLRQALRRIVAGLTREGVFPEFYVIEGAGAYDVCTMCKALGSKVTFCTNGTQPISNFSSFDTVRFLSEDNKAAFIKEADFVIAFDKLPEGVSRENATVLKTAKPKIESPPEVTTIKVRPLQVVRDATKNAPKNKAYDPYRDVNYVRDYQEKQTTIVPPYFERKIPDEVRDLMAPRRADPFFQEG